MTSELRLPNLGDGVTDVTITRWRVKVGDVVKPGDIVLEVATDKVDTEVPATSGGTILQLLVSEGELTPVTAVLAFIGEAGESTAASAAAAPAAAIAPAAAPVAEEIKATPVAQRVAAEAGVELAAVAGSGPGGRITKKDVLAHVEAAPPAAAPSAAPAPSAPAALTGDLADTVDPVVARLAAEERIDLRALAAGRVLSSLTKFDVLAAAGKTARVAPSAAAPAAPAAPVAAAPTPPPAPRPVEPAAPVAAAPAPRPVAPIAPAAPAAPAAAAPAALKPGEEFIPHSRVRLLTARYTTQAAQSIPHVTTWWDVNMTRVLAHRKAHKDEFARAGVNLTVTSYFIKAAVAGLKAVPTANSAWTDEGLILKKYYNIGMAVALPDNGLIVPVIKDVDDLSLLGVARAVNDLASRARANKLKIEELQGGTFSVSNYGTSGSRFQTPIIIEGQAGILGVGAIEKRAVVVSQGHPLEANTGDYLAFLPMLTLGFSYDHRILDGATADAVCAAIKQALESWE